MRPRSRTSTSRPSCGATASPASVAGTTRTTTSEPAGPDGQDLERRALEVARARVMERIEAACHRVGRASSGVTLVAVSKTVAVSRLRAAAAAGLRVLGENRVQEAEAKVAALPDVEWHLVGHLQSNKAARALRLFAVIESLDSMELARRLDRLAGEAGAAVPARVPVHLQVNVDDDPAKEGFAPHELRASLDEILALPRLEVRGLMTVGLLAPGPDAARATFVRLRRLSEELRAAHQGLGDDLSMGMSDDFEVAIEEGSTLVRVGRAIFGERAARA